MAVFFVVMIESYKWGAFPLFDYKAYERSPKRRAWKRAYDRKRSKKPNRIAWRQKYMREWTFVNKYGISLDEFDALKLAQNNQCAICLIPLVEGRGSRKLRVDHCHETKRVRGLLCNRCNILVGFIEKCSELLIPALKYLGR